MSRPGLVEEQQADRIVLAVRQRPFAPWALAGMFVGMPAAIMLAPLGGPLLAVSACLVPILLFLVGIGVERSSRLELTPARLRVVGWTGGLPRPGRHDLALARLEVAGMSNWRINGRPYWTLRLRDLDGQETSLSVLGLEEHEALRIEALIASHQARAVALHGEGAAEVPEALRDLPGRVTSGETVGPGGA